MTNTVGICRVILWNLCVVYVAAVSSNINVSCSSLSATLIAPVNDTQRYDYNCAMSSFVITISPPGSYPVNTTTPTLILNVWSAVKQIIVDGTFFGPINVFITVSWTPWLQLTDSYPFMQIASAAVLDIFSVTLNTTVLANNIGIASGFIVVNAWPSTLFEFNTTTIGYLTLINVCAFLNMQTPAVTGEFRMNIMANISYQRNSGACNSALVQWSSSVADVTVTVRGDDNPAASSSSLRPTIGISMLCSASSSGISFIWASNSITNASFIAHRMNLTATNGFLFYSSSNDLTSTSVAVYDSDISLNNDYWIFSYNGAIVGLNVMFLRTSLRLISLTSMIISEYNGNVQNVTLVFMNSHVEIGAASTMVQGSTASGSLETLAVISRHTVWNLGAAQLQWLAASGSTCQHLLCTVTFNIYLSTFIIFPLASLSKMVTGEIVVKVNLFQCNRMIAIAAAVNTTTPFVNEPLYAANITPGGTSWKVTEVFPPQQCANRSQTRTRSELFSLSSSMTASVAASHVNSSSSSATATTASSYSYSSSVSPSSTFSTTFSYRATPSSSFSITRTTESSSATRTAPSCTRYFSASGSVTKTSSPITVTCVSLSRPVLSTTRRKISKSVSLPEEGEECSTRPLQWRGVLTVNTTTSSFDGDISNTATLPTRTLLSCTRTNTSAPLSVYQNNNCMMVLEVGTVLPWRLVAVALPSAGAELSSNITEIGSGAFRVVLYPPQTTGWPMSSNPYVRQSLVVRLVFRCGVTVEQRDLQIVLLPEAIGLVYAAQVVASVALGFGALSGSLPTAVARLSLLTGALTCSDDVDSSSNGGGGTMIPLTIGPADDAQGSANRGAVVGNVVALCVVLALVVACGAGTVMWCTGAGFADAYRRVRLPTSLVPVLAIVLPSTISACVVLCSSLAGESGANAVLVVVGVGAIVCPSVWIPVRVWVSRGRLLTVEREPAATHTKSKSSSVSQLVALARRRWWRWRARKDAGVDGCLVAKRALAEGHVLLRDCRLLWYPVLDAVGSVVCGLLVGVESVTGWRGKCVFTAAAVLVVFALQLVVVAAVQPFTNPVSWGFSLVLLLLSSVSLLCQVVALHRDELASTVAGSIGGWTSAALTAALMVSGVSLVQNALTAVSLLMAVYRLLREVVAISSSASNNSSMTLNVDNSMPTHSNREEEEGEMFCNGEIDGDERLMDELALVDDSRFWSNEGTAALGGPTQILLAQDEDESELFDRID